MDGAVRNPQKRKEDEKKMRSKVRMTDFKSVKSKMHAKKTKTNFLPCRFVEDPTMKSGT